MRITITRPDSSTRVSTTFVLTLSLTPRKLTAITGEHEPHRDEHHDAVRQLEAEAAPRFAANAREAVLADVMPEHITMNVTMKVTKWMPNALCT